MSKQLHYSVTSGLIKEKMSKCKKTIIGIAATTVIAGSVAVPAFAAPSAHNNGRDSLRGDSSSTTLDACGYFIGTQTASEGSTTTLSDGSTYTTERGTWVGVMNNYGNGLVASLGNVRGSYSESYTVKSGVTTGVESFNSGAGKINQTYTYGTGVKGGFIVNVAATRDLSFLTSNTVGDCYTGQFPRP